MAVLYINLNEGNNVFKDINRTKDELDDVLSYLNSAYNQMSGAIYINGLQNYRDRITSEKRLVQEDITKVINFSKAYKNFLDNAKEIDKNYAKIIRDEGYAYRKETGLLKEEWKRAGKLIIGTLVIAGTVIAAIYIATPILIGAAVGACVSATLGAGMGYLTGGKDGAIDGFFSGSITGALSGAIGGAIGGVPPAMGSAPKEILKFMGKQSLIDGGVEGLGGGILGFINDGAKGAIKGTIGGFVSGAVTGFISGGVSFKFQKPKVSAKNLDDAVPTNVTNTINTVSEAERLKLSKWSYPPDDTVYLANKKIYDNPEYFNQINGDCIYPGTGGDINISGFTNGEYSVGQLEVGRVIDRYGENGSGKFFSPAGASFESRALPPFMSTQKLTTYEIIKEFDVKAGEIAPWFDQVGKGTQYFTDIKIIDFDGNYVDATVENLLKYEYIDEIIQ